MVCVDKAPTSSEYKLLQLRQYLSEEAIRVTESLGHSTTAYQATKGRLERKYGGQRRQVALRSQERDRFQPIRRGHTKNIDLFADLLDTAVINLRETGGLEELLNGTLYTKLQKKIPEQKLTQFY